MRKLKTCVQHNIWLTIELQSEEIHAFFLCLLSSSTSQVRYIDIPVLPVSELAAKMLVKHVKVVHQVGQQWSLGSVPVLEAADFLVWNATRRVS